MLGLLFGPNSDFPHDVPTVYSPERPCFFKSTYPSPGPCQDEPDKEMFMNTNHGHDHAGGRNHNWQQAPNP